MKWQYLYNHMTELLPPRAKIIMYLLKKIDDPNFDGFIIVTIQSVAEQVNASYATTQKVFKELQDKGFILKIQNGVYVPLIPVTRLKKKKIYKIAKENEISSSATIVKIGKEKYLCPIKASQYLIEK